MVGEANLPAFTASMAGNPVTLSYAQMSLQGNPVPSFNPAIKTSINYSPVTSSLSNILSVEGPQTVTIPSFTYAIKHNSKVTHYTCSAFTGSITMPSASAPYEGYLNAVGSSSIMQKSYVDIMYRNLKTFSGIVSRHKLYAQSNIFPGGFQLIDDAVIGPTECLVDPITVNKNYSTIGSFTNQDQVINYWFPSSASLVVSYSDDPQLNSMVISPVPDYSAADGNSYVIVKTTSLYFTNDYNYYPYDQAAYRQFSGNGYTSNFIFLAENTWYMLSANLVVNKNPNDLAKVMFFLTSSISSITTEQNYNPQFGLKIGEVDITGSMQTRYFADPQELFFMPANDYYGTLVIVPVNCEVIFSNMSLINYGDYGFSPESCNIQSPFPVNIANEKWTLKAELFDTNYNLIYTVPPIVVAFDPYGASLYGNNIVGTSTSTGGSGNQTNLTVTNNLFLPNLGEADPIHRFVAYNIPQHSPPLSGEGSLAYTQVSDVSLIPTNNDGVISTKDYINVSTVEGGISYDGRSIAVRYSGSLPGIYGRRVYVDQSGVKTTYS